MTTTLRVVSPMKHTPLDQLMDEISHAEDRLPDQTNKLRRKIATFERMYSMPSAEMKKAVTSGQISETHDICMWLMYLELLDDVAPAT